MKINNIFISKMSMDYGIVTFILESNEPGFGDNFIKVKAEISMPHLNEFSKILFDKITNKEKITIEVE
jgi:hypothetical protein